MRTIGTLFLLFCAVTLAAQQLSDQITVNVVEVPVYVSRSGTAVTGLTKEDFVLTVNGKPQTIDYFDVLANDAPAPRGAVAAQGPVDITRRRLIVLLFDLSQSSMASLRRARESADRLVREAPAGELFSVATIAPDGVSFVIPFMRDREAVRRAIVTLRGASGSDSFGIAAAAPGAWAAVAQADGSLTEKVQIWDETGVASDLMSEGTSRIVEQTEKRNDRFQRNIRSDLRRRACDHLGQMADRLAPLSGIKHVVLLAESASFPSPAEGGLMEDVVWPGEVWSAVRAMHGRFQKAGVVLDAVDIGASHAPWSPRDSDPYSSQFSQLHSLSLATGGTVTRELRQLNKSQKVTYLLAFRPPAGVTNGEIQVRLRDARPFTEVRFRQTFSTERRNEGHWTAEPLLLADVLLNDIPQNGLSVDLAVQEKDGRAVMTAKVPGVELLGLGPDLIVLHTYIYIFNEAGQVAEWAYRKSTLDLIKGREVLTTGPYTITSRASLPAGRYAAKVLLRTFNTDVTGFARADFVVNR